MIRRYIIDIPEEQFQANPHIVGSIIGDATYLEAKIETEILDEP